MFNTYPVSPSFLFFLPKGRDYGKLNIIWDLFSAFIKAFKWKRERKEKKGNVYDGMDRVNFGACLLWAGFCAFKMFNTYPVRKRERKEKRG
jgi:hypothetical protein